MARDLPSSIESVLIVDKDAGQRDALVRFLRERVIGEIKEVANGKDAWDALQKKTYSLIVLDWKLTGLAAPTLFSRIRRSKTARSTPILITAGMVMRQDFRFLQEFPGTTILEKPYDEKKLIEATDRVVSEISWYEKNAAEVTRLLTSTEEAELLRVTRDFLKKSPNPAALGVIIGRRLAAERQWNVAEKVLRGVIALDAQNVLAMNELGKIYCYTQRYADARSVLERAQQYSSGNIIRLLMLGEASLNLAEPSAARPQFEKALELDPADAFAQAGLIVARNMNEAFAGGLARGDVAASFASLMNTIGISMVHAGKFEKGLEQYRSALAFVRRGHDTAKLNFNIGLGFLRWGQTANAIKWFEKAHTSIPEGFAKARQQLERLSPGSLRGMPGLEEPDVALDTSAPVEPINIPSKVALIGGTDDSNNMILEEESIDGGRRMPAAGAVAKDELADLNLGDDIFDSDAMQELDDFFTAA